MIKIELTEDDAILFKAFRKHQDNFAILYASEVFETRSGVVSLSFNHEGVLTQINKDVLAYKRRLIERELA